MRAQHHRAVAETAAARRLVALFAWKSEQCRRRHPPPRCCRFEKHNPVRAREFRDGVLAGEEGDGAAAEDDAGDGDEGDGAGGGGGGEQPLLLLEGGGLAAGALVPASAASAAGGGAGLLAGGDPRAFVGRAAGQAGGSGDAVSAAGGQPAAAAVPGFMSEAAAFAAAKVAPADAETLGRGLLGEAPADLPGAIASRGGGPQGAPAAGLRRGGGQPGTRGGRGPVTEGFIGRSDDLSNRRQQRCSRLLSRATQSSTATSRRFVGACGPETSSSSSSSSDESEHGGARGGADRPQGTNPGMQSSWRAPWLVAAAASLRSRKRHSAAGGSFGPQAALGRAGEDRELLPLATRPAGSRRRQLSTLQIEAKAAARRARLLSSAAVKQLGELEQQQGQQRIRSAPSLHIPGPVCEADAGSAAPPLNPSVRGPGAAGSDVANGDDQRAQLQDNPAYDAASAGEAAASSGSGPQQRGGGGVSWAAQEAGDGGAGVLPPPSADPTWLAVRDNAARAPFGGAASEHADDWRAAEQVASESLLALRAQSLSYQQQRGDAFGRAPSVTQLGAPRIRHSFP